MSADARRIWKFCLATVGAAGLVGSVVGAAFGFVRTIGCVCCDEEGASL